MRVRGWAAVSVLAVAAVTGCSGHTTGAGASGTSSVAATGPAGSSASASQTPSVSIAVAPVDGATSVRPDTPVVVTVEGGTVSAAKLVSSDGEKLQGRVDGSGGWQASDALKPGTRYTLTVTAKGSDGDSATRTTTFRTLVPKATNRTTLIPGDDWTVGVGMPVVVSFACAGRQQAGRGQGADGHLDARRAGGLALDVVDRGAVPAGVLLARAEPR